MTRSLERTLAHGRAGLAALIDEVERFLDGPPVPAAVAQAVLIACDEAISNAIDHGTGDGDTPPVVELRLSVGNDGVDAEVADSGAAFDPLARAAPDTTLALEDRAIGGLGILLIRKLMDRVSYARADGRNRLRFSKTFPLE